MNVTDFNISHLGGMMPNQAYGWCAVDGCVFNRSWFFRARHGQWELRIGPKPVDNSEFDGEVVACGVDDYAGGWGGRELALCVLEAFAQLKPNV